MVRSEQESVQPERPFNPWESALPDNAIHLNIGEKGVIVDASFCQRLALIPLTRHLGRSGLIHLVELDGKAVKADLKPKTGYITEVNCLCDKLGCDPVHHKCHAREMMKDQGISLAEWNDQVKALKNAHRHIE